MKCPYVFDVWAFFIGAFQDVVFCRIAKPLNCQIACSQLDELISSSCQMVISLDPKTITSSGTYEVKRTTVYGDSEEEKEITNSLFSGTNWIESGNKLQFFGLGSSSTIYTIEFLSPTEMVLIQSLDNTYDSSGYTFDITGFRKFTFVR